MQEKPTFHGWWISVYAFFTFGLAVGIPYYGMPFFYTYYTEAFGWSRSDITFGFPIAALLTLWVGPLLVHRFQPRQMLLIGSTCTALAFVGFGTMGKSLLVYNALWVVYLIGYLFSGPVAHQVLTSNWFRNQRGKAMAVVYLGVGVFGGISSKFIAQPLTEALGFQNALLAIGALLLLIWPIALFLIKDKPADIGQFPDGADHAHAETKAAPASWEAILREPAFWLLLVGSACSIGSIGAINQHMKFIFQDQGFREPKVLDTLFSNALLCVLFSSIGGRLVMGYLADRFSKKVVMSVTYLMVAGTIPLITLVSPSSPEIVYIFAVLFGFGMGADYMLIPLMAAEKFGVNSLARVMAIILPTDTIGQTWFPWIVSKIQEQGGYPFALKVVFLLSAIGAVSILMLPNRKAASDSLASLAKATGD
jgi:MFS family permease